MIKLKKESARHPDYMKIVGAEMDKEYTVSEFINEILKMYPEDSGRINIDDKYLYEYKKGVFDFNMLGSDLMNRIVVNVEGLCSYCDTDYRLILTPDESKEEKKGVDIDEMLKEMCNEMHDMRRKYEEKYGLRIHSILVDKYKPKGISSEYKHELFGFNITV